MLPQTKVTVVFVFTYELVEGDLWPALELREPVDVATDRGDADVGCHTAPTDDPPAA